MPSFRDDHILIISPGSSQTLAQLGLPESYTPARFRFPTRMFRSIESGKYTYTKYRVLKEEEIQLLSEEEVNLLKEKATEKEQKSARAHQARDGDGDVIIGDGRAQANGKVEDDDEDMEDVEDGEGDEGDDDDEGDDGEGEGEGDDDQADAMSEDEEEEIGEEIVVIDEDESDAIWPLKEGRVTDWPVFFAFLQHIHEFINPPFHTPLLLTCPPSWSRYDRELVTQFAFERLKVPGFCLLDQASAITSAYGVETASVIDVGFEKTDITPIFGFIPKELAARTVNMGGETMTKHLHSLLPSWTYAEVEALKKSHICEILFPGTPSGENSREIQEDDGVTNVAAIVAAGKTHEYLAKKEKEKQEAQKGTASSKNLPNSEREKNTFWFVEKIPDYIEEAEEPPVIEIPAEPVPVPLTSPVVAAPQATEAAAPAETAPAPVDGTDAAPAAPTETAAATEGAPAEAPADAPPATTSPTAQPSETAAPSEANGASTDAAAPAATEASAPTTTDATAPTSEAPAPEKPTEVDAEMSEAPPADAPAAEAPAPAPAAEPVPTGPTPEEEEAARVAREEAKRKEKEKRKEEKRREGLAPDETRRQIEVGRERFKAAECGILSEIADVLYQSISSIDDISERQALWNSLIIVGNGARIRGFKEALLETISQRYLISPSSATIFTSEIPSSVSTPIPTGASTPNHPYPGGPIGSGVNPLLVAATHSNLQHPGYPGIPGPYGQPPMHGMPGQMGGHGHASHSQTPTSLKQVKFPDYFPEWKDAGTEEAVFLGAQVHAKVVFVVDTLGGASSRGYLSRVEYNEMGPGGIHAV